MFDKVVRHFYDDTCVVPEKVEGENTSECRIFKKKQLLCRRHVGNPVLLRAL